jgi:hypothetical protein
VIARTSAAALLITVTLAGCRAPAEAAAHSATAAAPGEAQLAPRTIAPILRVSDELVITGTDGKTASVVISDDGALGDGQDRWDGPVPFDLPGLPVAARRGAGWWIVTARGRGNAAVVAIAAEFLVYDDALRLTLQLREPFDSPQSAKNGVGGLGLAAPGRVDPSPTPRIVDVAPWRDLPREAVLADARGRAHGISDFASCSPTVEGIRGRFPAGQHAMIRVELDCPGDEFGAYGEVWMVDERGRFVAETGTPDYNEYEFLGVVDLDGDGIDEVVIAASYHEGSSEHLAHWNGKVWDAIALGGDGA